MESYKNIFTGGDFMFNRIGWKCFKKWELDKKEWRKHRMRVVNLKETMGTVAAMFKRESVRKYEYFCS